MFAVKTLKVQLSLIRSFKCRVNYLGSSTQDKMASTSVFESCGNAFMLD
ncbi:MAG: hypothetical protein ACI90Q_002610, partial [Nonlabens sp.]